MTSARDYLTSEDCANAPWITENNLVGTHNVSIATVNDNPPGHYSDPPISDYMLTLCTKGTGHARIDIGAGTLRDDVCVANALSIAAADCRAECQVNFMFSLIAIGLPKQLLAEATGRSINALDFEDLHKSYMRDPTLTRLVTDLNAEAIAGNPQGPLYSDHLLYSIAQRLAENARQSPFRMDRAAKLSADQLNRLVQKMEDDMEDGLTLSDLAELLDMPIFHFSRVFQRTVGVTPYRYLLLRRVSRAEGMLRDGRLSLAEIAYACGFSSQAHMTTAFAKYSGYSPGLIRRSLAG